MNAESRIDIGIETGTMTDEGRVLIPKALRDAAGLGPGVPYRMSVNDAGQIVLAAGRFTPEEAEARVRQVEAAMLAVAGRYRLPDGQTTDEYMREIRGDWPE